MENKFTKLKNWISASFQLITVGLLIFAITLILKQQNDISVLKSRIYDVDYNIDNVESNIDDIESKLDDVESNLSSEIDDVKRTVIMWSN
jgi:cell division protein FtsL